MLDACFGVEAIGVRFASGADADEIRWGSVIRRRIVAASGYPNSD
jgi:hypothetical protein